VGTLYGALDRLSAEGLVAADREEVVSGRLRRYSRITEEGVRVLTEQAERQAAQAAVALGRLRARRTGTGPQTAHRVAGAAAALAGLFPGTSPVTSAGKSTVIVTARAMAEATAQGGAA
jgi:hypothetical protein